MTEEQGQRIVLATRNAGKVRELAGPLADFGVEVMGLEAFLHIEEIEENGTSFEENALIKARVVADSTGLVSVADDSGLMVDALNGRPGVYSARYADDWQSLPGENRDQRNIRKLLHELAGMPEARRTCCFVCCMAAVKPGGAAMTVRGVWEGRLLTAPRGENGFGYDPVFFDPLIGKSAAQLSRRDKSARSHRGKALRALLARWQAFMTA
ncbi:RdgB/HAM1 family non-canonical purine NTP pyrophosphatase [uncultured Desulfovibrio sp.]|uniref:RdgB/HAM1 family non-canonical purine NTP pyrophosphatase n=1 Tax=uncultured Desulfovibrio sp. TaxID=167968 RepID=UPI00262C56C6|nr:RdgB/HAM1 family non-canonical purine NTP pyrophosphatase [uncultured Desulfovibrio sp.]